MFSMPYGLLVMLAWSIWKTHAQLGGYLGLDIGSYLKQAVFPARLRVWMTLAQSCNTHVYVEIILKGQSIYWIL